MALLSPCPSCCTFRTSSSRCWSTTATSNRLQMPFRMQMNAIAVWMCIRTPCGMTRLQLTAWRWSLVPETQTNKKFNWFRIRQLNRVSSWTHVGASTTVEACICFGLPVQWVWAASIYFKTILHLAQRNVKRFSRAWNFVQLRRNCIRRNRVAVSFVFRLSLDFAENEKENVNNLFKKK